jgi:hypothetical protein
VLPPPIPEEGIALFRRQDAWKRGTPAERRCMLRILYGHAESFVDAAKKQLFPLRKTGRVRGSEIGRHRSMF